MQQIINKILRDHGAIDNGISEVIHNTLDPMIQATIHKELNLAEIASKAMQGMLANPAYEDMGDEELVKICIDCSIHLLAGLDDLRGKENAH